MGPKKQKILLEKEQELMRLREMNDQHRPQYLDAFPYGAAALPPSSMLNHLQLLRQEAAASDYMAEAESYGNYDPHRRLGPSAFSSVQEHVPFCFPTREQLKFDDPHHSVLSSETLDESSRSSSTDEPLSLVIRDNRNRETLEEEPPQPGTSTDTQMKKKKKDQQCRLCANHGIYALMRGHKHFCPNLNCSCDSCTITKNRQHFMKEQQRMTRKQEQEMMNKQRSDMESTSSTPTIEYRHREYPDVRRQEMERDLADIDPVLLDEVQKLCKKGGERKKKKKDSTP